MIKIYHNPRCRKSREGLAYLQEKGVEFETVLYLQDTPDKGELQEILDALGITPMELIRKNEAVWKSAFKGKELSDAQLIEAMAAHPKLIERPVVINGNKAVIARPASLIDSIL